MSSLCIASNGVCARVSSGLRNDAIEVVTEIVARQKFRLFLQLQPVNQHFVDEPPQFGHVIDNLFRERNPVGNRA